LGGDFFKGLGGKSIKKRDRMANERRGILERKLNLSYFEQLKNEVPLQHFIETAVIGRSGKEGKDWAEGESDQ